MPAKSSPAIFKSEEQLAPLSASERIRYRLVGANCRYHANDNISAFIEGGRDGVLPPVVQTPTATWGADGRYFWRW